MRRRESQGTPWVRLVDTLGGSGKLAVIRETQSVCANIACGKPSGRRGKKLAA